MLGSIHSEEPSPGSHSHSLPRGPALGSGIAERARPPAAVGDSLGLAPPSLDAAHGYKQLQHQIRSALLHWACELLPSQSECVTLLGFQAQFTMLQHMNWVEETCHSQV